MTDVEKLTRDAISQGGVLAMIYFDIHAKTKELVQELGTGFVNEIVHRSGVVFALGEIDEPIGGDEKTNWSSSIAIKILTKNFAVLAAVCMANSPYNVEILRPDEIKLPLAEAHTLLGTMSATTAEYKRYILTKISKPDELASLQENLKRRADMGKKIMEKEEG
ncbi:MAG: hypothetical protein ABID61_06740 [Candidatus Micrarchaeota archaeon]